jgi:hypothetical protein
VAKKNTLSQVDAHIGTQAEQASQLRLSVPTLNPVAKNMKKLKDISSIADPSPSSGSH